ncbi:molecular chaperone [Nitratireductor rhodophyticola]|uniref:Molecular chaperone n=1 Tax=Nitratireductor rhodophyticola TaxID=2854036 RepID=A0ABS7R818_9HYPH|nr:molecular chaperone [Nitratireductor rhodophyticola]MBY8917085.1 molecular chaperone [Nitratireductor rhodophyticola]MBY8920486.1 molecular chaperone [Nitratireductor rhodophyticola]MEC9244086.1 molecular chaperone [Pseudomonadota bacterium]WPZ14836.1 molecular chaperone [Nitratireductor rhodophyticola]
MRTLLTGLGAIALFALCGLSPSSAASLRVAPTTVDMIAPDSAAVLNLRNEANRPINVQVRVYRWTQEGGVDRLQPTRDVVASPPATQLPAGADYVLRIVRVARRPVQGEESYRVVVDELPDRARQRAGTVSLVVRHSIPVFFRSENAGAPQVAWSVSRSGATLMLVARNNGAGRLRLSDVRISQGARRIGRRDGLVGYVLGGATMQWPIGSAGSVGGGPAALRAQSHLGPVEATVPVR